MKRRDFISIIAGLPFAGAALGQETTLRARVETLLLQAGALEALETVIVTRDGELVAERGYRDNSLEGSTNIKSASKSIVSCLVGIAIDRGLLSGVDQPIETVLRPEFPQNADPRLSKITVGHLLSMQSGLERMSGPNYGRWVASRNWVRTALAAGFVDDPGGGMLYSTASTHLLSVILAKVGRRPTLALARDWLGPLEGFRIGSWDRDPQGYYFGGNQMAMTPRSLHAFGELYRRRGVTADGTRLVSERWIDESWTRRTNSVFNGDGYGYGWFLKRMAGEQVNYAWGYGGQMLYIVPGLGLTVVMTSSESAPSARTGYRDDLHRLLDGIILATAA
jgi:Beta-lactamase class C and other penicillin binding proteins